MIEKLYADGNGYRYSAAVGTAQLHMDEAKSPYQEYNEFAKSVEEDKISVTERGKARYFESMKAY